jgi:hypothetical protein
MAQRPPSGLPAGRRDADPDPSLIPPAVRVDALGERRARRSPTRRALVVHADLTRAGLAPIAETIDRAADAGFPGVVAELPADATLSLDAGLRVVRLAQRAQDRGVTFTLAAPGARTRQALETLPAAPALTITRCVFDALDDERHPLAG